MCGGSRKATANESAASSSFFALRYSAGDDPSFNPPSHEYDRLPASTITSLPGHDEKAVLVLRVGFAFITKVRDDLKFTSQCERAKLYAAKAGLVSHDQRLKFVALPDRAQIVVYTTGDSRYKNRA
jgi:hypothetical protein